MVSAKKPTKFMTNSKVIGHELSRKCDGNHVHQPLIDGRAKDAARYPQRVMSSHLSRHIQGEDAEGIRLRRDAVHKTVPASESPRPREAS